MDSFEERLTRFNEYTDGRMKQVTSEAFMAYQAVRQIKPATFVEVGGDFGGSFYVYAGACKPGATVICIDNVKTSECLADVVDRLRSEGYNAHWVRGTSHLPMTIEKVKKLLRGKPIQFLHIDGEHSAKAAIADWNAYSPLTCGLIAFHDIALRHGRASVYKAWPRIREKGRMWCELLGPLGYIGFRVGIGLVWKDTENEDVAH